MSSPPSLDRPQPGDFSKAALPLHTCRQIGPKTGLIDAVGDDRVEEFYPSLYLNRGKSREDLGNLVDACRFYTLASERVDYLPERPYGAVVCRGVMDGLGRISDLSKSELQTRPQHARYSN